MKFYKQQTKLYKISLIVLLLFCLLMISVLLINPYISNNTFEKLLNPISHAKFIVFGGLIGAIIGLIIEFVNSKKKYIS